MRTGRSPLLASLLAVMACQHIGARPECDARHAHVCTEQGTAYEDGRGVPQDAHRAAELFDHACQFNDAAGCDASADVYEHGRGVPADAVRAFALHQRACTLGDAHACVAAAHLATSDRAGDADDAKALALYLQACTGGELAGCREAGLFYALGRGTAVDDVQADVFYTRACDGRDAHGCTDLGTMNVQGRGTPKDEERGFELLKQGCDLGDMPGCLRMGDMFAKGRFVALDMTRANALYKKACDGGYELGCKRLRPTKTCLVLSVGGPKGIAHLGALEAIRQAGVKIDCVYGNSMGSLVGSLYASAPTEDVTTRYLAFIDAYSQKTKKVAARNGVGAGLLALVVAGLSGGALAPAALAGTAGFAVAAEETPRLDNKRFQGVMSAFLHGANIEDLPIPFATSYQHVSGTGLDFVFAGKGSVAEAVGRSINNPLIFAGTNLDYLDPGSDRAAAVPIEDACRVFRPTRIIAINVSGEPSFHRSIDCDVIEVTVPTGEIAQDIMPAVMMGQGDVAKQLFKAGYDATAAALVQLQQQEQAP